MLSFSESKTSGRHDGIGGYRSITHLEARSKCLVVRCKHKVRRIDAMKITSLWRALDIERRT